ncbi:MAG: peptidylprolyl isomerase [Pseudomonadales bacterium]|nr:peptidylprolyl isomerase [Pseudomonadales bacterium]MCP5213982.1 peptidylprolyl isomerase [Pseudomonadales bacterium]MCP5302810.1 peptidylprolyl isomerase [Pseudomonadales bacterium]
MSNSALNTQAIEKDLPNIIVNGATISKETLALELQYHPAASAEEAITKAAQALIIQELFVQEAVAQGLDQELKPFESETKSEALIRSLIEAEVEAPQTDEISCRRYFEQNRERFRSPDLVEACHILLAADPQDPQARDSAKIQAEELLAVLQQDSSQFTALVKQYSDCPSKETDGNLGQLSKGQTTPEFERQLFMLDPGLAAHVIESRYGYHVVRVDRKISGDPLPFEQVREKIVSYLTEQGNRRAVRQYIHGLMEKATIEGIDIDEINSPLTH